MKIEFTLLDEELEFKDELVKAIKTNFRNAIIDIKIAEGRSDIMVISDDNMEESQLKLLLIYTISKLELDPYLNDFNKTIPTTRYIYQASLEKLPKPVSMNPFMEIVEFRDIAKDKRQYNFDLICSIIEDDMREECLKGRSDLELVGFGKDNIHSYINLDITTLSTVSNHIICKCNGKCTSIYDVVLMLIYRLSFEIKNNNIMAKIIGVIVFNLMNNRCFDNNLTINSFPITLVINLKEEN